MKQTLSRRQWLGAATASAFGTWAGRLLGFRAKPAPSVPRRKAAWALGRPAYGAVSGVVWSTYYYDADGQVYWYDETGARRYVVPLSSSVVTYEICGSTVRVLDRQDTTLGSA
jgi:hypothetical protein